MANLPLALQPYAEEIAKSALPCVRLIPDEGPSKSHFGGSPILPTGQAWPVTTDGRDLSHLVTIDLGELPRIEGNFLPKSGSLSFFYDVEEQPWGHEEQKDGWRVLWRSNDDAGFLGGGPAEPPEPAFMRFSTELSYPHEHDLDLSEEAEEIYDEELLDEDALHFQMFGHEQVIQNPLGENFPGHLLLLQVPSNDELGYSWGDVGNLYFAITPDDMAAGRFENVRFILECY